MKMQHIPFATTDWAAVPREEKSAEAGQAFWRTQQFGDVRVRMVEYTPGYVRERVCDLAGVALERNRDEWMLRMRRMGSCPCKQMRHSIARFRSNPSGSGLGGRSAALRRLWIAGLSTAHRALHPIPPRPLRDPWEIANTFLDHWCTKGHVLLCLSGELHTELADGRQYTLTPGMSYQVADNAESHRSTSPQGATLFIVD